MNEPIIIDGEEVNVEMVLDPDCRPGVMYFIPKPSRQSIDVDEAPTTGTVGE